MSPDNNCSGQLLVELRIKAMQPELIPGPVQAILETFKAGPGISCPKLCWVECASILLQQNERIDRYGSGLCLI